MKKIERPESTTYVLDFPFHYIKDEKEAKNIFGNLKEEDFLVVQKKKMIDDNFNPLMALAIKDTNKPFSEWLKYIVRMELVVDVREG